VGDYLNTAVPEPMAILGQRLHPLSIGHLLLLDRFGCVPVNSSDSLITAVLICSRPVDDVVPTLEDRWLPLKLWILRWRLGEVDWTAKIKLWEQWLTEQTSAPTVIKKTEGGDLKHSATPFLQHLKVTLQSKLNYSPAEAFAAPFSQALWDYYVFHELEGTMEIADAEERKAMRKMADDNHDEWVKQAIAESAERAAAVKTNGAN